MSSASSPPKVPPIGGVRFAPSPTGRFHVGNLRTAWISFRWARTLALPWVVRVEDIDRPRVLSGAQELQLDDLARLGMSPDALFVQSDFHERHWQVFAHAVREGQVYPCDCSRKEVQTALAGLASAPHEAPALYSGRCRERGGQALSPSESLAWRFRMPDDSGHEDFIVARSAPGLRPEDRTAGLSSFTPAYHWACAIDDFDGHHALLVRSLDLKPAARLQHAIQRWLSDVEGLSRPFLSAVFHTSLVTQNDGHRLEKRTKGVTLSELEARGFSAERLLGLFERSFDREILTNAGSSGWITAGAMSEESEASLSLDRLGL